MELGISFGIDEIPPEPGDKCMHCDQIILEVKFCYYLICGSVTNVEYLGQMCKYCYVEKWLTTDESDDPPSET